MLIRNLMAPEGVSDGGGGGGGSNGASAPAAPAAAPSRGRIGDFSVLRDGGDAPAPSGARVPPPRESMRSPLPGDEGVEPVGATDEPTEAGPEAGSDTDLEVDPSQAQETELGADAPLFGMAPAELVASLRDGKVPAEMMNAIMGMQFNVPVDGQNYPMTIPEMQKAAMRGVDYSRKTREIAEVRRQAQGVLEREQQRTAAWRDDPTGSALHDGLLEMGIGYDVVTKSGPLYEIAKFVAAQQREFDALTPAEQRARVREMQAEERANKLEREAQQLEQQRARQSHAERTQAHSAEISRLMPVALAKFQIKDSKLSRQLFGDGLRAAVAADPKASRITPELLDAAAEYTRDALIDLGRYEKPAAAPAGQQPPQQRRPQGLSGAPPVTALPGAVRPGQNPGRPKQGRIGDLSPLYRRS